VVETEPTDIERLRGIVVPVFEPIATGIIVLILTAFLLVQREDVRNRFIRLMGQGRITVTTRTIDEAGQRDQPLPAHPDRSSTRPSAWS
jgi:hypothetical protein